MQTEDRQHVRDLANTMAATYKGDEAGLKDAQQNAHHVIEGLHESFPGESDETLCIAACAAAQIMSRIAQLPLAYAAQSLQAMVCAYPLAAGALIGVYSLPEHECNTDAETPGRPAITPESDDSGHTGFYL